MCDAFNGDLVRPRQILLSYRQRAVNIKFFLASLTRGEAEYLSFNKCYLSKI